MFVRIRGSLGLWRVRKCFAISFWVGIVMDCFILCGGGGEL